MYPRENNSNKNLYMYIHRSIIHKSQKVGKTKCPSIDKWINKVQYIHTMEYYSDLKKNEILIHATVWMNLKIIVNVK